MADTKISALTSAATPLAGTEVLPIVQSSATVKVAVDNLTVKNVRSNATTGILQVAGPGASATRVMTTPDANFSVARIDAAQTFTGIQTVTSSTASTQQLDIGSTTTVPRVHLGMQHAGNGNAFLTTNFYNQGGDQYDDTSRGTTAIYLNSTTTDWGVNFGVSSVVGGTPTTRLKISNVGDISVSTGNIIPITGGKGVNFTANTPAAGMTSQLLDWYEEGTWTPAYEAFAGAFTTLTYTAQQGTYTRIGRTVICNFNIAVNTVVTGTAATLLLLSGFPFALTADGLAAGRAGGFINFYVNFITNAPTMVNWAGYTDKLGLLYDGATNISNTPPANVAAGCELHGCVIYQI